MPKATAKATSRAYTSTKPIMLCLFAVMNFAVSVIAAKDAGLLPPPSPPKKDGFLHVPAPLSHMSIQKEGDAGLLLPSPLKKDDFLHVPAPFAKIVKVKVGDDAKAAYDALIVHPGIAAHRARFVHQRIAAHPRRRASQPSIMTQWPFQQSRPASAPARKLLSTSRSPPPPPARPPPPPPPARHHFNEDLLSGLTPNSPDDQDYITRGLDSLENQMNRGDLKALLQVYNDGSLGLDNMAHAGAYAHLQEAEAMEEIMTGSDYDWPGILNKMPHNLTCTIIPGARPTIVAMNVDELQLHRILEVNRAGLLDLNKPDVCDEKSPNFLITQMKSVVANAKENQKHWRIVIQNMSLLVAFTIIGFCCCCCCLINDSYVDGEYEANGIRLFKYTMSGIIYVGVFGTSLILTINEHFKHIFLEIWEQLKKIKHNMVRNMVRNRVGPIEDPLSPTGVVLENLGGSKKTSQTYKKTAEKYGKRCVYLSKRNAKYLKINGNFVAYKTAVKMLNKK